MRKFLTALSLVLASALVSAQMPGMGAGNRGGGPQMNGSFYGKVIDSITNKPVDAASVQLLVNKYDSVSKKRKDVILDGMLTQANGDFRLENVPVMGQVKLVISAIGFKPFQKSLSLIDMKTMQSMRSNTGGQDMMSMIGNLDKDLGNIKLIIDEKLLSNVTVNSTKPLVQLAIDRKIYNVDKDLMAAGGTAVDVMKNVPSVSVDIDGNVTLRNNTPQIYVDGRPTTLTLEQIPADQIQSVEVITNPSAKFDASGGTAGILNIVLKKNRKAGYSGNLRAGIDERAKINVGGDINLKQGKINVFANANYGQRKSISNGTTTRSTFLKPPYTNLTQKDKNVNDGYFMFGRAGFDYFLDNRNTITLSGLAVRGNFKPYTLSDIYVDTVLSSGNKTSYTNRTANTSGNFRNLGTSLSYLHNFPQNGHQLSADINYNRSRNSNSNLIMNDVFAVAGGPQTSSYDQQQVGSGSFKQFNAQTDYANPISATSKLEAGARISQRDVDSKNDIGILRPDGSVTILAPLSSNYKYTDRVLAAYGTYSGRIKENFGYQLGLRVESSDYHGTVHSSVKSGTGFADTSSSYSNSYPISFFPSLFLTQKLKGNQDLQLNYSRRINRPNFFQLFPFTDYSDSLNLSRGNPNLKPEFTNSIELAYQKTFPKSNSLLISVYYKYTTDLITRYQSQEINPVTDSLVFVNTFINANSSFVGGLEIISKNKLAKWWDITTNLNLYTSKINSNDPLVTTVGQMNSWFAKVNNTFKLPKNLSLQLSGDYNSKTVLSPGGSASSGGGGMGRGFGPNVSGSSQGYSKPTYGVDAALRYEFLKNKTASLTLSVSDIFKTRKSDVVTQAYSFTQESYRTRDQQFFRLNFAYRFGKFDVSLFKRKNLKAEQENMQSGMQGAQ
ncbi:MAG TPA: TonB-dependent receptor [Chitinophagaceae bacterium]|nr:TonB-dependent receptor [Chitinophagaceae bacterium]